MASLDTTNDYSFLPTRYHNLKRCYEKQRDSFWVPNEIDFSGLNKEFNKLSDDEKKFVTFVLFFFSQSDGIVIENLVGNFKRETSKYKEARYFYAMQEAIETIHNETYSIMIDVMIEDPVLKTKGFDAISNYPSISKLADWMKVYMDSSISLMIRIVAFACVEGIFFSAPFCSAYWLKRRNTLIPFGAANELIAADEALHVEFAGELYKTVIAEGDAEQLTDAVLHAVIRSAVDVSREFVEEALRVDLIGMNSKSMMEYVECCADEICSMFGAAPAYGTVNPFTWMAVISLPNQTNFFERRNVVYNRAQDNVKEDSYAFDEDF